jgi:hypothetical protein
MELFGAISKSLRKKADGRPSGYRFMKGRGIRKREMIDEIIQVTDIRNKKDRKRCREACHKIFP